MIRLECPSYPMSIFMSGDLKDAFNVCMEYCERVGFCVTLNGTGYIYRGKGRSAARGVHSPGFVVGLINYPRFPMEPDQLWERARELAELLREACGAESYSIQAPDRTEFTSYRPTPALPNPITHPGG